MGGKGGGGVGSAATRAGASTFWSSNPARRAAFKTLASALATGGRGMKSGFVQQAVARSREAGMQALRTAGGSMAGTDPSIASRVLNRISRTNMAATNSIGPSFAQAMIDQAPAALTGAAAGVNAGYQAQATGEAAAAQAAQTRAAGWGAAANGVASGVGSAVERLTRPSDTPPNTTTTPGTAGPWFQGYQAPSWFDRFRS